MLFVTGSRRAERLHICEACEHYVEQTKTCGTLIVGKAVHHEGEVRRLCGCVMPIKTQLKTSSCPLGKWHNVIKPEEVDRLRELVADIKRRPNMNTSADDRVYMVDMFNQITGQRRNHSSCKSCYRNMIKEIESIIASHDQRDSQALPEKT